MEMRQTLNFSGFVHSQAYVKAIACLVLACGGGQVLSSHQVRPHQAFLFKLFNRIVPPLKVW